MSDNQKESAKKLCLERNSSKEFQQNAQRAKIIKYGNKLVSEYGGFNEYLWNSRKLPHGTKYSKAIEILGSEECLCKEFQFNDKWKDTIIELEKEVKDKEDIEKLRKQEVKNKMTEIHRETMQHNWESDEFRQKKINDLIKLNKDKEFKEKSTQNLINYNKSQEHRELASKNMIELNHKQWKDKNFRERHAEIHRNSIAVVETARKLMSDKWSTPGFKDDMLRKSYDTKKKNNTFKTSNPEDKAYDSIKARYPDVIRQYKCKRYPFMCDFYIPSIDTFIEFQGNWTHGKHPYNEKSEIDNKILQYWKSKADKNPYYQVAIDVWTSSDVRKRNIARENNLNYLEFYRLSDLYIWLNKNETDLNKLFGYTKEKVFSICREWEFLGTDRYPSNHPIWDCNTKGKLSPRRAWYDDKYLKLAIQYLFSVVHNCILYGTEPKFVERVRNSFTTQTGIIKEVLLRFTVAKIAPCVTAISKSQVLKIINESGLDISSGVYCPMAGFGGIIEASKEFTSDVEAYDINPNLCNWYGWTQRDVLKQVIYTNKTVIVCPPFDYKEQWDGTPDERDDEYKTNYHSFEKWCKLIKEHVIAPQYIFIGPEVKSRKGSGLFAKTSGVQYYPDNF